MSVAEQPGAFGYGSAGQATPSLRKRLVTCTLADLGLMANSAPIWALVRPAPALSADGAAGA
jgi:hypothetical protein